MSSDQRFTPIKPLQESSDEAWSLLVDGNIDVYICPGDHLALGDPNDGMITGRILAAAIGMRYRALFGRLPRLQRNYKEKKAIQKFRLGVEVFLHSRKGKFTMATLSAIETPRRYGLFLKYIQHLTITIFV